MWNEKTKQMVTDGKLVVIGVIQEQHAERCQLYRQWKQYEFPIVQDAFGSLALAVVPVPILIDEFGVVMSTRPRMNSIESLVAKKTTAPANVAPLLNAEHATVRWARNLVESNESVEALSVLGDALLHEGSPGSVRKAIHVYGKALTLSESAKSDSDRSLRGPLFFRLGVAHRQLFDGSDQDSVNPKDFALAAENWSKALDENPNQYIWRRRIQQYGPRQIKPYPFYDWVATAQQEIRDRGENPIDLAVSLTGAEIAQPKRTFASDKNQKANPDPQGKITRDLEGLVRLSSTVVPHRVKPGQSVRVHVRLDPLAAKWNNEAGEMVAWIDQSESGTPQRSHIAYRQVEDPESTETRSIEFEFKTNADASKNVVLTGYILYYVCKTDESQCLYRRQDFEVQVTLAPK